ncbi:MAG: ABC transporter ATP-binding protein [Henriciella sp.]|nr:ABC transporter ATP-binding protein [Henriciella sp.]
MATNLPLTADHVSKAYAGGTVVDDVSLTLLPGKLTALIGGSGAGKSTLLRLFAGFERVDSGEIRYGEQLLSSRRKLVEPKHRHTGLIFQDFALFPHLNIIQNIMFGLTAMDKQERLKTASDWVSQMQLDHRREAYPHQLSGGEQQRVAIARALAPEPRAILMDEPFSGLDPSLRTETRQMALSAVKQAHIPALLVTHDPAEALRHADQIAVMSGGKLLQSGTAEHIYFEPENETVASALGPVFKHEVSTLPAPWQSDFSGRQHIYWRPEALQPDPDGAVQARVTSVAGVGSAAVINVKLGPFECQISPQTARPAVGDQVRLALDPRAVFAF